MPENEDATSDKSSASDSLGTEEASHATKGKGVWSTPTMTRISGMETEGKGAPGDAENGTWTAPS